MRSIKLEPTEEESPFNGINAVSVPAPVDSRKRQWTSKGDACQADAADREDEKDDTLTMTLAADALPLNNEATNEDVKPEFDPVDDHSADGPVIEEVNPEEVKEEIPDNVIVSEIQVESRQMAVQVASDAPRVSSRASTRTKSANVPTVDEVIVKSEEEGILSSQPPIIEQMNPSEAESRGHESTINVENRNVNDESEIKEEEEGPVIEEVNPDDYPLSPRDNTTSQEVKMKETTANQMNIHVESHPVVTGTESTVFEPFDDNLNYADPMIEEVNPEEIKEEIPDNVEETIANLDAVMQVEASYMAVQASSDAPLISSGGSTRSRSVANVPAVDDDSVKSESDEPGETVSSQLPIIEQVNPDDYPLSPWAGNASEEAEMDVEETSQVAVHVVDAFPVASGNELQGFAAADDNLDDPIIEEVNPDDYPLSPRPGTSSQEAKMEVEASQMGSQVNSASRRSTRARKSMLNYALLFEAEEDESTQDEPETGASDTEESDFDETEADSEMETDGDPSQTRRRSSSNSAGSSRNSRRDSSGRRVWPCQFCGKELSSKSSVQRHEDISHRKLEKRRPFPCLFADCGRAFETKSHLDKHAIIHSGLRPFTCTTCGFSFNRKSNLRSHQRTHSTAERPFVCSFCGKALSSKNSLQRHEDIRHRKLEKRRPFPCTFPDCGWAFESQSHLDKHTIIHSGLRPYVCTTCNATFNQKSNLASHQRTHTTERPYVCSVCSKAFKKKATLASHVLLHAPVKPFTCPDCGGSFTEKTKLERHQKSVIPCTSRNTPCPSRPFNCTVEGCVKAFRKRANLLKHLRNHSSVRRFKCTVCEQEFKRKYGLKIHNRKFHSN